MRTTSIKTRNIKSKNAEYIETLKEAIEVLEIKSADCSSVSNTIVAIFEDLLIYIIKI